MAGIDPLFPKVERQLPCQVPVKTMYCTTLNMATFDFPPPGDGFVATTGKLPATLRSELLSVVMRRPLLANETASGIPLNVTEDDGTNPLPTILSVSGPPPARRKLV
jgi:hypothetical protein